MTVRVLLAEDQAMVRGALSALLSLEYDIFPTWRSST
jgi:DNA-binding NarL/FixJ family response regulator